MEEKQWFKGRKESKKLAISITSMAWQSTKKENDEKKIANEYTRGSVNTHLFVDGGIQNVTLATTWIKTE